MERSRFVWVVAVAVGCLVTPSAARQAAAQGTALVRGVVTDSASRRPIENAQISIVGRTARALTGGTGQYTLRGLAPGAVTVRVQILGYAPGEQRVTLAAGDTATVDFALARRAVQLSQVVVSVGYGTASRADVSSAVASVSGADIVNTPVAGLDAALQGKAAGVQVVQNAGNPGNGITVRVRGAASISASNQPLYVIDGVPMLRESFTQLDLGGQDLTAVTGISPDEIESIDVLKDAAAAAIYGSRGSNGVVLITTKRGRAGTTRFNVNAFTGRQEAAKTLDMLNAQEYVAFFNEAAANDGYEPEDYPFTPGVDDTIRTDWQDAVLRTAQVSDAQADVSGGTDRLQYFVSGALFDQRGIAIGSGYNRVNARANLDVAASSRFSLKTSVGLIREDVDRIENDNSIYGVVGNAIALQPNVPVRRADGEFATPDDGLEYANPVALGELNSSTATTLRAVGNVEATFNATSRFRLTGRLGIDALNLRERQWQSPLIVGTYAASVSGVGIEATSTATRYLTEGFGTWDALQDERNRLALTAGGSVELNQTNPNYLRGEGFGGDFFRYVGSAARLVDFDSDPTEYNLVSFFSRANYSLLERYLLSASFRTDGASRFGRNNRYGVFPSASVGWIATREPFMEGLSRFGEFKLRASYGVTGNQGIDDDFATFGRFTKAAYVGEPGIARSDFENEDLRWERTREFDVGFDLSLFEGRLQLIGDYYQKKTSDLLVERPITLTTGQREIWQNVGNVENRGVELGLTTTNVRAAARGGFEWTTDFNISWNRNRVTALFAEQPFNTGIRSINRVEVGAPLGAFHALRFLGVDPQTGDAIHEDITGDGEITALDRQIIGSPHPTYWGGFGNTLRFRGFDLRGFFEFSHGAEVFNGVRVFADDAGYYFDNKFASVLDRWQQPGDVTNVPRASYDGTSGGREISSRFVEDGSYVRLQEVTLGYQLPASFAGVTRLRSARVYVSGRNLKVFSDYSGYDPDVNSNGSTANTSLGTDFYAYPRARAINVGITAGW